MTSKRPTPLELFDVFGNNENSLYLGMRDSLKLFIAQNDFKRLDGYFYECKDWSAARLIFTKMTDAELRQFSDIIRKVIGRDAIDGAKENRYIEAVMKLLVLIDAYAGGDDIDADAIDKAAQAEKDANNARMHMRGSLFY